MAALGYCNGPVYEPYYYGGFRRPYVEAVPVPIVERRGFGRGWEGGFGRGRVGHARAQIPVDGQQQQAYTVESNYAPTQDDYDHEWANGGLPANDGYDDPHVYVANDTLNPQPSDASARAKYMEACASSALSGKVHNFVKINCASCAGHTLMRDNEVHEHNHTLASCAKVLPVAGHNGGGGGGDMSDSDSGSDSESDSSESADDEKNNEAEKMTMMSDEASLLATAGKSGRKAKKAAMAKKMHHLEEKKMAMKKKGAHKRYEDEMNMERGTLTEIVIDSPVQLARALDTASANNTPVRASFDKEVKSDDGTQSRLVNFTVATSRQNTEGKAAVHLALTPYDERGLKMSESRVGATVWHIDATKSGQARIAHQPKGVQALVDAGVEKEFTFAAIKFVEEAFGKMK